MITSKNHPVCFAAREKGVSPHGANRIFCSMPQNPVRVIFEGQGKGGSRGINTPADSD